MKAECIHIQTLQTYKHSKHTNKTNRDGPNGLAKCQLGYLLRPSFNREGKATLRIPIVIVNIQALNKYPKNPSRIFVEIAKKVSTILRNSRVLLGNSGFLRNH